VLSPGKSAGSDGRCNTFSNRLVQWDFSGSNHLRVLYLIRPKQGYFFVDLSSEDEVRRLKLLHLDTELVLLRPIESTSVIGNIGTGTVLSTFTEPLLMLIVRSNALNLP
jgi:hypothetical protein